MIYYGINTTNNRRFNLIMKVTYIRLENVAGIFVGSNKTEIEVNFEKSKNNIVAIVGDNGTGKTVLLSSINPFSSVSSLDERSTLSYIIPGKNGYKEIHYVRDDDEFIIKHYYKATKDSHTVKSYFSMNGNELNDNGNVSSFLVLVEMHLGLTQDMMRLIRLGTNVNSFISLSSGKRKEYIGKRINDIDALMSIYKQINDDIKVTKVMLSSNNMNLYNCHISDILLEEEKLSKMIKTISERESERDKIVSKMSKIRSLINDNDIDDLRRKYQEAESSINEFKKIESSIKELALEAISVDELIGKRSNITEKKITIQSKINSYRISIDNTLRNIEQLEISVKKITSDNDMKSLVTAISDLRETIKSTNKMIKDFVPRGSTSEQIYQMISKLTSFNQISQMIHTFGTKPTAVYLKLKRSKKSIDVFLKDQMKYNMSRISSNDINMLFDSVFKDDIIITPNCDTEYAECPYYRFSEVINEVKDKLDDEYDDETLRYIKVISNNIDNILNEIDRMEKIAIPDSMRDGLTEKRILHRLENHLPFFDLTDLQEFLSILREYELYCQNIDKLKQYEHQLSIYKSSGVDTHINEIKRLQESVTFYRNNIATLEEDIKNVNRDLSDIDGQIALLTKFNDSKKYRKIFETTLESTKKILKPLESASQEKMELEFELKQVTNVINVTREEHKALESRINEYKKLTKEGAALSKQLADLSLIAKAVYTKEGIPVIYMKRYLKKIQALANELLHVIYGDDLRLGKFNVTYDTFEIPYIKNGIRVPDVRYASQSEVSLMTMALSFALANGASKDYNILLLDETDSGLDENNRLSFFKMLYMQMKILKAEQVFIISQNLSQMVNIPMDCIKLSDVCTKSKLQTIIYE